MDTLTYAKFFAAQKHAGQSYGVLPYTHHLQDVERTLRRFGIDDEDMLVAAWLHDVVEDTTVKLRDIEELFGDEVARLVGAVTSEEGPDRKTRNALTYPKIRAAGARAVVLKLVDRIANVESGGRAIGMYCREHADFRHALFTGSTGDGTRDIHYTAANMWGHLDSLLDGGR